ncbi:hypothetical protein [Breoghania sp.]|uniref:hypothetical protein n=1 Tax=Breoghania sp. TaxID=2065378 RepID=UPI002AAB0FF9|nr:hypothetical protein [Breoghania sp.]
MNRARKLIANGPGARVRLPVRVALRAWKASRGVKASAIFCLRARFQVEDNAIIHTVLVEGIVFRRAFTGG